MKILFLLLFVSSCSSGLTIKSDRSCPSDTRLLSDQELSSGEANFIWREFGFGRQTVNYTMLLEKAKAPSCARIEGLRFKIESDGIDQLISAIPFVSQWSVNLKWKEKKASSK